MSDNLPPTVVVMVDIETLGMGSDAVVSQMAYMAVPADDPEERISFDSYYLPIQPQIDAGRVLTWSTIWFWFQQDDKARLKFEQNIGEDSESLMAFVRSFCHKLTQVRQAAKGPVEFWAKGPQFDMVILESLIRMCGETPPWEYNEVRDLRTMMALAGIGTNDVDSTGIVKHVALEDCRYQIKCYLESVRALAGAR